MFGNINLLTVFTTGLLTGGISCLAVQGGLLTAVLAQEKTDLHAKKENIRPVATFLVAKLIVYTILGAFLGWIGSLFQLSLPATIALQFFVVVFMVGTALHLLNVHPIFRYFVIQPPEFLTSYAHKQRAAWFGPALMGCFTVFIPCGATQAMLALAVASGQPVVGAIILFAFVLGTSPVFFGLGYLTMKLGDILRYRFSEVAAVAVLLLALYNFDSTLALTGTQYTLHNAAKATYCIFSYCDDIFHPQLVPVDEQTILITPNGYSPNTFAVKAGSQVKLHIVNKGVSGCMQALTIPALNTQKIVLPKTSGDFVFTAPAKPGPISFMCSQGNYPGVIQVI